MITKAIEKINDEINKYDNEPTIKIIGEFLLQQLANNPDVAEKILNPEKTIAKSLEEMKKVAEKSIEKSKKAGAITVALTDQQGFEIVLKYYDIQEKKPNSSFDYLKNLID